MKLGPNFFFWLIAILEALKSLLTRRPKDEPNPLEPGERMFKAIAKRLTRDNEDDDRTGAEIPDD